MTRVRRHLSFANVVASIALFAALGGVGYAAVVLERNSVGAKHLKKNAVTAKKIKKGAVNSRKVRNNSLLAEDFQAGQFPSGGTGPEGPRGPQGESGPPGADGSDGSDGADGTALAFARVQADGTLQPDVGGAFPSQVKGIDAGDVVKGEGGAATGTYCFGNLGTRLSSAVVSLDNADAAAADRNLVASVAIDRGEDLGDCPGTHNQARVRIVDGNTEAAQNARFFIWFE